jgi:hypothetical protein
MDGIMQHGAVRRSTRVPGSESCSQRAQYPRQMRRRAPAVTRDIFQHLYVHRV